MDQKQKELPVFIRNRVKTIKENTPNSDLRCMPGNNNPADIGSRGTTSQELMSFKLWWEGPTFLSQPKNKWPTDITSDPTMETYHAEEDQTSSTTTEDFINAKRFSTWIKPHRTVYYFLLFLAKTSTRAKQHYGNNRSALFNKAETILFRLARKQNPPSEEVKTQLQLYHCNNSDDGKLIYQQRIECQASPVCELIECSLCLELIYNPNCWSRTQIVMTASFLFAPILTLCILHPILRLLSILTRISALVFRRTIQKVFSKISRKSEDFAVHTGNPRKPLLAIIFAITITPTEHCSDVISVTASEETCVQNQIDNTCTFNQASVVTLQPLNQEMCLLLKNNSNNCAGMITIRVKRLYFTCKRKVEFFTRDHHFYSESVHRCRFAGSCNTETCDKIKPTDKLPELSHTANKHPGYTFCAASCGCPTCSGCFFCLTSCLFYRYYAYQESPTVYTVLTVRYGNSLLMYTSRFKRMVTLKEHT